MNTPKVNTLQTTEDLRAAKALFSAAEALRTTTQKLIDIASRLADSVLETPNTHEQVINTAFILDQEIKRFSNWTITLKRILSQAYEDRTNIKVELVSV